MLGIYIISEFYHIYTMYILCVHIFFLKADPQRKLCIDFKHIYSANVEFIFSHPAKYYFGKYTLNIYLSGFRHATCNCQTYNFSVCCIYLVT